MPRARFFRVSSRAEPQSFRSTVRTGTGFSAMPGLCRQHSHLRHWRRRGCPCARGDPERQRNDGDGPPAGGRVELYSFTARRIGCQMHSPFWPPSMRWVAILRRLASRLQILKVWRVAAHAAFVSVMETRCSSMKATMPIRRRWPRRLRSLATPKLRDALLCSARCGTWSGKRRPSCRPGGARACGWRRLCTSRRIGHGATCRGA